MKIACLNPQGNFDPTNFGLTAHPDFGGQLVYVKELSQALGRLGHSVDILTRRIVDPKWPPFAGLLDGYPDAPAVRIVRLPCGPPEFLPKEQLWPYLPEWAKNIAEFYQREGQMPDIFTAHYGDGGLAGALLKKSHGRPFTFTGHSLGAQKLDRLITQGVSLQDLNQRYQMPIRIAAERTAMALADRIIVSSRLERFEQYGHPLYRSAVNPAEEAKFALVPPGVNLEIFDANRRTKGEERVQEKVEAAMRRDLSPNRLQLPCVIASSRLEPKKNVPGLVRAWAVDQRLRQAANLLLVVRSSNQPLVDWQQSLSGTERDVFAQIVQEIQTHRLQGMVCAFQLDSQAELAAAYRYLASRKQGVFALTALYEPFGLAPLEAMAAGLPAVVTRNGGPEESLRNRKGHYVAHLINPENPREIARALLQLVTDAERWQTYRQMGRRHVLRHFSWEATARGYLDVCRQILNGQSAARDDVPIPEFLERPTAHPPSVPSDWLTTYVQNARQAASPPKV